MGDCNADYWKTRKYFSAADMGAPHADTPRLYRDKITPTDNFKAIFVLMRAICQPELNSRSLPAVPSEVNL